MQAISPVRIALDESSTDTGKLNQLLARLNLKELRISNVPSEPGTSADVTDKPPMPTQHQSTEKIEIKLAGDRYDVPVSASKELPREMVGARTTVVRPNIVTLVQSKPQQVASTLVQQSSLNGTPVAAQPAPELPTQNSPETQSLIITEKPSEFLTLGAVTRRLNEKTGRIETVPTGSESADETAMNFDAMSQSIDTRTSAADRKDSQSVRITLPDDIRTTLKPNGRAVTISIEPDHLGPAKLHLSMRDSALTARVTVDTSHARTMVEQSLDQLTQQLHRAGIKVDLIEVNVAGDQSQQQHFFERNFGMRRRMRMLNDSDDSILAAEAAAPIVATPGRAGVAGPNGVNLYA